MDDVRVNRADRRQPAFEMVDLDRLVPEDHRVRAVWAFVETLDLGSEHAASPPSRPKRPSASRS